MERYEQICPGAADRVLKQWETQTDHRQGIEKKVVDANIANSRRGQWFALIMGLAVLAMSGVLLYLGLNGAAIATIVAEIVAFAAVFITGRRKANRELDAKRTSIEAAASRTIQS